ncbi:MAG: lipoyl(octanoyl) transferase LipB [Deltaproteobacteria bacterium]|jgi:lipoate-protein ligase B
MTGAKNISNSVKDAHPLSTEGNATTDNGRQPTDPKTWLSIDFDRIDYREAWQLQSNLIKARKAGILQTDTAIFLEHPPVFTLGRRGGRECMLVSEKFLEKSGIQVIQVERGGNITYHGPGQLIVYPVVDIQTARIKVVDFVNSLEEVMLRTAAHWGIAAERNPINRGIWAGPRKLGSIGIAVRRGVSFHGLALNVQTDLTPFSWIQPCGLKDVAMTTMQQETTQQLSMQHVRAFLKKQFEAVFGIKLLKTELDDLNAIFGNSISSSQTAGV